MYFYYDGHHNPLCLAQFVGGLCTLSYFVLFQTNDLFEGISNNYYNNIQSQRRVSNSLDPDQARPSAGSDLGTMCSQTLSAAISRQQVNSV